MKKGLLGVLIFFFNVMPIYALSFKLEPSFDNRTVSVGETVSIDVYLKDINDTQSGISACTMKINGDTGIVIKDGIQTYGNWQGLNGAKGYSFDTLDEILSDTKIFTISVTVNQSGSVKFSDIVCTNIEDIQSSAVDKTVTFTVENVSSSSSQPSSSSNNSSNQSASSKSSSTTSKPSSSSSSSKPSSNSSTLPSSSSQPSSSSSSSSSSDNVGIYLSDIIITGGTIDFNKEVYEYNVLVDDLGNVNVRCIVDPETAVECSPSESIEGDLVNYLITVWNKEGKTQKYSLYLTEKSPMSSATGLPEPVVDEKKDYSGIFIAIIVILLLVNVGRIGYNLSKKNK